MTIHTEEISIRPYETSQFDAIQQLNREEGWMNLIHNEEQTKAAWKHADIAFIAESAGQVVGCVRGLTDGSITLYICELLIAKEYRGRGIGQQLLQYVHELYPQTRMEMLANSTSKSFYEQQGYRPFYGFRKTLGE